MKISNVKFLIKFKELFIAKKSYIATFAFWKMQYLIENGETFYLPEYDCYYLIYIVKPLENCSQFSITSEACKAAKAAVD